MPGKKYAPEFRNQVVRAVIDDSRTIADVAREYKLVEQTVGIWVNNTRRARAEDPNSATANTSETELAELRRLRKEVHDLKAEKEFLGKAAAFFAKEYR